MVSRSARHIVAVFLMSVFILSSACGITENTGPGSETSEAESLVQEQAIIQATEEHLASLPKWERDRLKMIEDEKARSELRLDAKRQMELWVQESGPKCDDYFGTSGCNLTVIELQPSERCGWRFSRYIRSLNDLKENGHYYGLFVNEQGRLSGGYHWIASFNHQAYVDGAVLNITQCWNENPSETQLD